MNRSLPSTVRNRRGQRLDIAIHHGLPDNSMLLVLGHGVTGNKDRPLLITLAERLASEGITTLRLSFSGNGGSEGAFEESTISREVEDLRDLLDALRGWEIGYAGHSMGAAVGVLTASVDPRIRFLVSLAGMIHTAEFARREFGEVTPGAGLMWDKPECPLSKAYVDDMNAVNSVLPAAKRVSVPWLLVHGTADDVVPLQDSKDVIQAVSGPTLIEIPDGDHVFTAPHDATMAGHVASWLQGLRAP